MKFIEMSLKNFNNYDDDDDADGRMVMAMEMVIMIETPLRKQGTSDFVIT